MNKYKKYFLISFKNMEDEIKNLQDKIKELEAQKGDKSNGLGKKYVYKIEDEQELQKLEIDKNIVLRVLNVADKKMIDIRRYYKGYPTKKGIRFSYETYNMIKKLVE